MRKLASVQKVAAVTPIEGADRIELVHVLGWQCVAAKDEFKVGDLVVYFEIDSFLPINEKFEFLRNNCYKKSPLLGEGFRIKTMKFRGKYSQGLCMSLDKFGLHDVGEGTDVTEMLGVREWETPEIAGSSGTLKGGRPSYIPKTNEVRVQSCPELFEEFRGLPYYITTKMDGSSFSIGYNDGEIAYTTHNCTIVDDGTSAFVKYCKDRNFPEQMAAYCKVHGLKSLVLQGEWCGEGIQSNRLQLKTPTWFLFTAIVNGKRVGLDMLENISIGIGCTMVPVEEVGPDLCESYPTIDILIKRAEGVGYNNTSREGLVIRPTDPVYSDAIDSELSMKVLNNKYLLKNEG